MSAAFPHLRLTNASPSDSELRAIQALLAPDEAALAKIESERQRLTDALEKLREERKILRSRIRSDLAIVSLLRRFPTELLQLIFIHSLPPARHCAINVCDSPMVLLRVCKSWRDTALHTPALWSSLFLSIPHSLHHSEDENKISAFKEEVRRWLSRSDPLPLNLSFRKSLGAPYGESPQTVKLLQEVSKEVVQYSDRWRVLDLELAPSVVECFAKFPSSQGVTQLKTLRLVNYQWWMPSAGASIFSCNALTNAPNLTRLHIWTNDDAIYNLANLPVNWSNLTSLIVGNTYPSNPTTSINGGSMRPSTVVAFTQVLAKCQNLVDCSFTFATTGFQRIEEETTTTSRIITTSPSLRALHLVGCCAQIERFLGRIDLPCIRELHYLPHYEITEHTWTAFLNILRFHGHQIEVLSFDLPSLTNDAFLSILTSVTNIKQLGIGPQAADGGHIVTSTTYKFNNDDRNGPLAFTDSHFSLFIPKVNEPLDGHPYPHLEIFKCNILSRVTPGTVLRFLDSMMTPAPLSSSLNANTETTMARSPRKFRELSLDQLPLDFPLATNTYPHSYSPWGSEHIDPLKSYRDAGIHVNLDLSMHYKPTVYYSGHIISRRHSYATYFGSEQ